MSDPKRLFEELERGELKELLAAGKSETPDDHQMMALAAKIGILGGLGGAGAAGAGGAGGAGAGAIAGVAKGGLAIKIVSAVAVAGAVGAGTVAVTKKVEAPREAPIGIVASAPPSSAIAASEPSVRLAPRIDPLASASAEPSAKQAPSVTAAKSAPPPSPVDEVKLLERAQDALKTRPDEALALCNDHARSFPSGMLAQEREVIAIEALVKTGRTDEARARAAKFKARWPGSSHTRRIDALVSP